MRFPSARIGDPVSHDLITPSGVIGLPLTGPSSKGRVVIEGKQAAHIGCTVTCCGATAFGLAHLPTPLPPTIVQGSKTVKINGAPAARWTFKSEDSTCRARPGCLLELATRTVWIGD